MSDEILRGIFGEGPPLSDREKLIRRHAAVFALITLDETFAQPNQQTRLGVHLTDEQIQQALAFAERNPHPGYNLEMPTMFNYDFLIHYAIHDIPRTLAIEPNPQDRPMFPFAAESLDKDPTGVSFLERFVRDSSELATEGTFDHAGKIPEVKELYVTDDIKIKKQTEERMRRITQELREAFLEDSGSEVLSYDDEQLIRELRDELLRSRIEDAIKSSKRYVRYMETGLLPDENDLPVPAETLFARGDKMAFDRYKSAVDYFFQLDLNSF